MTFHPAIHKRRTIRLAGYNYEQEGLYFITICVQDQMHLFGQIVDTPFGDEAECQIMVLNEVGIMVEQEWLKLPGRFPEIRLHQYIVMPNHFHGII